jgi:DNA-directed RNA polymerase specialized sigma24 family protein
MEVATAGELTDAELAARAARRDRSAFHRLVDRHARPLAAWLLRRLPPAEAADVLQDTLLKAWRASSTYRGGNYRTWLFQIARSCMPDGQLISDHAAAVERCLSRLDDRERDLLRARFGGREDLSAACARLGMDKKTAQNLISLALAKLRECLERWSQA